MNWKRIARDLAILLLMCGTFYLSSLMIGQFDNEPKKKETSFTPARVEADRLVERSQWSPASEIFANMTVKDPYDGYAWYRLGMSYLNQRMETQGEIESLDAEGATKMEIEPLQLQLAETDRQAIETFKKSQEFLRYRGKSLLHLACVYAQRNEFDTAMDYLQKFVDEGNWAYRGLANVSELGTGGTDAFFDSSVVNSESRLHQFYRFWRIVRQEYSTRRSQYQRGDGDGY